jgi:hypothetical protein
VIFIILVCLAGIITLGVAVVAFWNGDVEDAVISGLLALIGSLVGGVVIFIGGFVWWMIPDLEETDQTTYSLAALGTGDQLEGRAYFLGGGYIGDQRVLNYVRETDPAGGFQVKSIPADRAVIFESDGAPTVTIHDYEARNPWLAPWSWDATYLATFEVPEGSVLNDYSISNTGRD